MSPVADTFGRPLRNLRLSVTDRCNLRCSYCMPEEHYVWLPKPNVLSFEEIVRAVDAFADLGVDELRLTGGEPLLRSELPTLVRMLAARGRMKDLAMTTNGVLLREHAPALRDAGLQRLTVSLDTLDPATFRQLSRRDDLPRVLAGLEAARDAGFTGTKIDTVVIAGVNDAELPAMVDFARGVGAEIRFIEYMDVGGATNWSPQHVVSRAQMLERVRQSHGTIRELPRNDSAPAERFELPDGTRFGIIASVTKPFCATCDRSRLTADGMWFTCLYATHGTDLRELLRGGGDDAALRARITEVWQGRRDRGAEVRAALPDRRALAEASSLRQNPHLEMHTRGG